MDKTIKVSTLPAIWSGFALSWDSNSGAVFGTGRDFYFEVCLFRSLSTAVTRAARVRDDLACAVTLRTCFLNTEETLGSLNRARTATM